MALTLLELLEALKGNLKGILVGEPRGVVEDVDPEQGNDRHLDGCGWLYCGREERVL